MLSESIHDCCRGVESSPLRIDACVHRLRPLPWICLGNRWQEFQQMTLHAVFCNNLGYSFGLRIRPIFEALRLAPARGADRSTVTCSSALFQSTKLCQNRPPAVRIYQRRCFRSSATNMASNFGVQTCEHAKRFEPTLCTTWPCFLGNTARRATRRGCTWRLAIKWGQAARFGLTPVWAFAWSRRRRLSHSGKLS